MLALLCFQVVQTNDNESNAKEKKETSTFYYTQAKDMWACEEIKKN